VSVRLGITVSETPAPPGNVLMTSAPFSVSDFVWSSVKTPVMPSLAWKLPSLSPAKAGAPAAINTAVAAPASQTCFIIPPMFSPPSNGPGDIARTENPTSHL
jgi:hypothetical protein